VGVTPGPSIKEEPLSTNITHSTPDYGFSARETPGEATRVSALLATDVGRYPDDCSDSALDGGDLVACDSNYTSYRPEIVTREESERDYPIAATWAVYDEMLALFDAGFGPEPQGPWADPDGEDHAHDVADPVAGSPSERTLRRRRAVRKSEINALLARDGRRSVQGAIARVTSRRSAGDDRWMQMCEFCAQRFESVRTDARFCSDRCRKASGRRQRSE
jgi:hypothetical protein